MYVDTVVIWVGLGMMLVVIVGSGSLVRSSLISVIGGVDHVMPLPI